MARYRGVFLAYLIRDIEPVIKQSCSGKRAMVGDQDGMKLHPTSRNILFWVVIGVVMDEICLMIGFSQAPAVHFFPLGREEDMGALTLGTWTRCGAGGPGRQGQSVYCTYAYAAWSRGKQTNATLKCRG